MKNRAHRLQGFNTPFDLMGYIVHHDGQVQPCVHRNAYVYNRPVR